MLAYDKTTRVLVRNLTTSLLSLADGSKLNPSAERWLELTDAQLATQRASSDTLVLTSIGQVPVANLPVFTVAKALGSYPVAAFRQAGNDDTSMLQRVFQEAGEDECIEFDPAVTYTIAGGVQALDRAVRLNGRGAKIRRPGEGGVNQPLFDVRFAFRGTGAVSVINTTSVDFGNGGVSVSQLTAASGLVALAQAGDAIKIVSDDALPSSPAEDNERLGETAYVVSKDTTAGTITLDRLLIEAFVTNIRAALLTNKPVIIEGFEGTDQSGSKVRTNALVNLVGAVAPLLRNNRFHDLTCPAIQLTSCIGAMTVNTYAADLISDHPANKFGYAVVEYGCVDGVHTNIGARRLRHAYTTGAKGVGAGGDISLFGGALRSQIINIDAQGCFGAALDTHSDCFGIIFRGGVVRDTKAGSNTGEACIQLRGRRVHVDGVHTFGAQALKVISNAQAAGADGGHIVRLIHDRPANVQAAGVPVIYIAGRAAQRGIEVTLDARIRVDGGSPTLVLAEYCTLEYNIDARYSQSDENPASPVNPAVIEALSSTTRGRMAADFSGSTGAAVPRLVRSTSTTTVLDVERARVKAGPAGYHVGDCNNAAALVRVQDLDADVAPLSGSGFVSSNGGTLWAALRINGTKVSDGSATQNAANNSLTLSSGGFRTLNASLTADITTTLTTTGFQPGTTFEFVRTAASTGAFVWKIGTLADLASGQWARIKLSAANGWMLVARGSL